MNSVLQTQGQVGYIARYDVYGKSVDYEENIRQNKKQAE